MHTSMKRSLRRKALAAAAALAASAMLASCAGADGGGGTEGGGEGPIRIAALYPTSGSLALLGDESWRGARLAVDELNAAGGIDGREIELVQADVPDVNAATSEARRLLDAEGLDLAIGTYSSALALAGSEVFARGGGTYIELGAVTLEFNERGYENVLRTNPNAGDMSAAQLDFIVNWVAPELGVELGDLNVLLVHEDSSYGSSLARSFEENAEAEGVTNVSAAPYSADSTDLSSTVLGIRQAEPDVVVAVSYAADAILLGRQMEENGVVVPAFIGSGGGHTLAGFGETLGEAADHVFNVDFPQYNVNTENTPGLEEFLALYDETYDSFPGSGHSLANYAGMQIVFEILRSTGGDTSSEAVMEAAQAVDIPEGELATGWGAQFDEKGQNQRASDYVTQWLDGEQATVWPESVATADPVLAGQ